MPSFPVDVVVFWKPVFPLLVLALGELLFGVSVEASSVISGWSLQQDQQITIMGGYRSSRWRMAFHGEFDQGQTAQAMGGLNGPGFSLGRLRYSGLSALVRNPDSLSETGHFEDSGVDADLSAQKPHRWGASINLFSESLGLSYDGESGHHQGALRWSSSLEHALKIDAILHFGHKVSRVPEEAWWNGEPGSSGGWFLGLGVRCRQIEGPRMISASFLSYLKEHRHPSFAVVLAGAWTGSPWLLDISVFAATPFFRNSSDRETPVLKARSEGRYQPATGLFFVVEMNLTLDDVNASTMAPRISSEWECGWSQDDWSLRISSQWAGRSSSSSSSLPDDSLRPVSCEMRWTYRRESLKTGLFCGWSSEQRWYGGGVLKWAPLFGFSLDIQGRLIDVFETLRLHWSLDLKFQKDRNTYRFSWIAEHDHLRHAHRISTKWMLKLSWELDVANPDS